MGGKQQQEILSIWTDFLTDMDKATKKYCTDSLNGINKFKRLIHDTVVYGSDRTVKLLSAYSHSVYQGTPETEYRKYAKEIEREIGDNSYA